MWSRGSNPTPPRMRATRHASTGRSGIMCEGMRDGAANPGGHDFLERVSGSIDAQRHLQIVELAGQLGHAVAAGLLLDPAQVRIDGVEADRAGLRIVAGRDAG